MVDGTSRFVMDGRQRVGDTRTYNCFLTKNGKINENKAMEKAQKAISGLRRMACSVTEKEK